MAGVTVTGGNNETVVLSVGSAQNALIAQELASIVSKSVSDGTLIAKNYTGLRLPPPIPGSAEEIVIKSPAAVVLAKEAKVVVNDSKSAVVFGGGAAKVAPLTVRLAELSGTRGAEWQLLSAGAFIAMIVPVIVFLSLQRYFVRGLLAGSVKG